MNRQQQDLILRLWRDWCRVWPRHYGHGSLDVKPEGYDPSFDLIPAQTYKDFYFEVVRGHPMLKHLNAFEIVDVALNQTRAPETAPSQGTPPLDELEETLGLPVVEEDDFDEVDLDEAADSMEPFIVEVELQPVFDPRQSEQRKDTA